MVSQAKQSYLFSSPRAKSARAFTGRWYPHSGEGEDFLTRRPISFFYKNSHKSETRSRKSIPRWEMNRLSKGYKQAVDQYCMAKIGFLGQKPRFRAQKKTFTS